MLVFTFTADFDDAMARLSYPVIEEAFESAILLFFLRLSKVAYFF